MNKPIDQQSDCWSTEAFASDSETHSEDGSNLQRLASQYQTASSLIITDPLGKNIRIKVFFLIEFIYTDQSYLDQATPSRQGTLTAASTT